MSSIRIELQGDTDDLLKKLKQLSEDDRRGLFNAMGEAVRTSVMDRFDTETDPDGNKWKPSVRAQNDRGKTLTLTGTLRNSIHTKATEEGFAVGTNDIRAATHQFGDKRTIKAENGRSIKRNIPARPFLGFNEEDREELMEMLRDYFEEQI